MSILYRGVKKDMAL